MSMATTPSAPHDDRVAVELAHLGELVGEHADAQQQVLERGDVGRRPRRGSRTAAVTTAATRTRSAASTSVSGTSRSAVSRTSSAATPPMPNSTSGPKRGSWVTPTIVSMPGVDHRLHDHAAQRVAERGRHRRRTRRAPRRRLRDRARRRRRRSCARSRRRRPSARRGSRARSAAATAASAESACRSGRDRDAEAAAAASAACSGVEPDRPRGAGERVGRRCRGRRPGRCRRGPGPRPRAGARHSAWSRGAAERDRGGLGEREGRDRAPVAVARLQDLGRVRLGRGSTRRPASRPASSAAATIARATSSESVTSGGTKITITASMPGSASTVAQRALVGRGGRGRRRGRPGCATDASGDDEARGARPGSRPRAPAPRGPRPRRRRPRGCPGPPPFETIATRRPAGSGWWTSTCAVSSSSLERVDAR